MKNKISHSKFLFLIYTFIICFNLNAQEKENIESFFIAKEVSKFNTASENLSLQRFVFD